MNWLRLNAALIQLLLIGQSHGAQRRPHLRMDRLLGDTMYLNALIGTPPKETGLQMDLRLDELILVDYDCSYPPHALRCPRFCDDESMRRLFCRSMCHQPSKYVFCGNEWLYLYSNSSTFRDLREDQPLMFKGYRSYYGHRAADIFQFKALQVNKTAREEGNRIYLGQRLVLNLTNATFVRGLSSEIRYVNVRPGFLGLRPGNRSFVPRLKADGYLGRAVISFQNDGPIEYSTSFVRSLSTIMFGALDKSACVWKRLPARNLDGWTLEISDVNFMGHTITGKSVARIELDTPMIEIPPDLADHYLSAGVFELSHTSPRSKRGRGYPMFRISRQNLTDLRLEFKVGGKLVKLSADSLLSYGLNTNLAPGRECRYGDEAEWAFGTRILADVCYGYDYERAEVAWGWRRRPNLPRIII